MLGLRYYIFGIVLLFHHYMSSGIKFQDLTKRQSLFVNSLTIEKKFTQKIMHAWTCWYNIECLMLQNKCINDYTQPHLNNNQIIPATL